MSCKCTNEFCTTDKYEEVSSCERKKHEKKQYTSLNWTYGKVVNGIIPIELYWVNHYIHPEQIKILILNPNIQNDDQDLANYERASTYYMSRQATFYKRRCFYIRIPYYIIEQTIEIGIACDDWWDHMHCDSPIIHPTVLQKVCDTQIIKVSSLLLKEVFHVGDKVIANHPHSVLAYPAVIIAKKLKNPDGTIFTQYAKSKSKSKLYENYEVLKYRVKMDTLTMCLNNLSSHGYVFNLHPNQIHSKRIIEYSNVIDTCNTGYYRNEIECDLILGSNHKNIRQFYSNLRNTIQSIFKPHVPKHFIVREHKYEPLQRCNYEFIGGYLGYIICTYVFDLQSYNNDVPTEIHTSKYQIRCFHNTSFKSEDGFLCFEQLWKKIIRIRLNKIHCGNIKPTDTLDIQEFSCDPKVTHICDLCNIEIHHNDWVAYCQKSGVTHDYCLPCTYTMVKEITSFEKYLQDIIEKLYNEYLNKDCIQVLVAFVLGYANVHECY